MTKSKLIILAIISILLIGSFSACNIIGSKTDDDPMPTIDFHIEDTLSDGGGKKASVILLGGQSNASGCSLDEYLKKNADPQKYAEYEAGYDNVYINYYATGSNQSNGFVNCSVRQGEYIAGVGGYYGPELGLAEKLHEAYPDRTFFIIKCAWGGTNLYEQWLSPSSKGATGSLYVNFIKFVDESLEYLASKNYDIEIEAMCWMQGESDSFSVAHGKGYRKNLENFISDLRDRYSSYASDDGIAFIDATIAANSDIWKYHELVNRSKQRVADSSDMNILIDTNANGLTCLEEPTASPDIAHYDSLSQIKLGHLFAEAVLQFID